MEIDPSWNRLPERGAYNTGQVYGINLFFLHPKTRPT
jgi:hypothetical protein